MTTSRSAEESDDLHDDWYTLTQLADKLKSEELAKIAITSCEDRPHKRNKALRDAGVKEYRWLEDKTVYSEKKKQKVLRHAPTPSTNPEIEKSKHQQFQKS